MSPNRLTKRRKTRLKIATLSGQIEVETVSGYDAQSGAWVCPLREALGLDPGVSQTVSPHLVERLCFTATQALSYKAAERIAHICGKWPMPFTTNPNKPANGSNPLLHQLRHHGEAGVLKTLENLGGLVRQLNEDGLQKVEANVAYFHTNRDRLAYARNSQWGCPVGSGAMELTCAQHQDRFKRTEQFWTTPGASALMTLDLIHRNQEWDQYWSDNG